MHHHPTAGHAREAGCRDDDGRDLQRAVLRALIEEPSDDGLELASLAAKLDRTGADVAETIDVLVSAGLVHRRGNLVRATGATLHFDELWRTVR
jgi:DNA-binding MarR family transcriptional regulator